MRAGTWVDNSDPKFTCSISMNQHVVSAELSTIFIPLTARIIPGSLASFWHKGQSLIILQINIQTLHSSTVVSIIM
jgi:hypothetical protein